MPALIASVSWMYSWSIMGKNGNKKSITIKIHSGTSDINKPARYPNARYHSLGVAMMGTSALFHENLFISGSPGAYYWRGRMDVEQMAPNHNSDSSSSSSTSSPSSSSFSTSSSSTSTSHLYYPRRAGTGGKPNQEGFANDAYMGMSLAASSKIDGR